MRVVIEMLALVGKRRSKLKDLRLMIEMKIPESTLYKDLHGDVNIPSISLDSLQTYLKTADKTMDSNAKSL